MRMCFFLCPFSSHRKPLWLTCLLGAGPGSHRTLPKELFGSFLTVTAPRKGKNCTYPKPPRKHTGMGFTDCPKICIAFPRNCHPPPAPCLLCHQQPAWACSLLLLHSLSGISWVTPGRKRCEIKSGTKHPFPATAEAGGKSPAAFSNTNIVKNRALLNSLLCLQLV